jgi:hypothetical protein
MVCVCVYVLAKKHITMTVYVHHNTSCQVMMQFFNITTYYPPQISKCSHQPSTARRLTNAHSPAIKAFAV